MYRKVLITGASSGIGEAAARAFARQECELFLVARRQERLERVAEECGRLGASRVLVRRRDLSTPGEGAVVVRDCLRELGGLEVLVCNAGYGVYGPVHEIDPARMARIWQVNYQSGYESIHGALPHLIEQQRGHIVLVSSVIGKKALPFAGVYCATKFAQAALGDSLWGELRGTGVGASVICPGFTATEFQDSAGKSRSTQSMPRLGAGQDPAIVADAILDAIESGRREVHLTLSGKFLCLMERISPHLTSMILSRIISP